MTPRTRTPLHPWFPLALLALLASACCPTGVWLDNFGNQYQILTVPSLLPDTPRVTGGTVDTLGWGCGIWNVRELLPGEPYDPANPVAFVVENPYPNPYDNCCYSYRFDGGETSSGCVALRGRFQTLGGKCNQSGDMVIEIFP